MTIILKDGQSTLDPRLDRIPQFDEQSRAFGVREILAAGLPPRSYTWRCPVWLDQGQEGACVGFAWAHEIAARPKPQPADETTARGIYRRAQMIDEWPGESYEGTSVLAGAKATKELGRIVEYRWAFGLQDLVTAVGYKGPAILGVNWYEGMARTDPDGLVRVEGDVLGGHAILCYAVNVKKRLFRLRNSWGLNWGISGDCFILFDDVERLLSERGEACIPVVRR